MATWKMIDGEHNVNHMGVFKIIVMWLFVILS